jgi:predicted ATPase
MHTEAQPEILLRLEGGLEIGGSGPVVVVGPNGSGKTRQTRTIEADGTEVQFINALRNTRVNPDLPALGAEQARNQYRSQRNQARSSYWEMSAEFDYMLSQLLAESSIAAIEFARRCKEGAATAEDAPETPLSRVEELWEKVFVGRSLHWRDWRPMIRSSTEGRGPTEYSGHQMSDGEKAALFVAARTLSSDAGVLVVDEPETHLHTLLAVKLWNELEDARPDIRLVFVTHDLSFALSRRNARYVVASPTAGLRLIELEESVPNDIREALLGAASLSFYASRAVFCEGDEDSIDFRLLSAWFDGPDTVVRPVGSCDTVMQCVRALDASQIAASLEAVGVIDRDFHNDSRLGALPAGVRALNVHEVESLLCLPAVVAAVCEHQGRPFDQDGYFQALRATVPADQRHAVVVERWKARVEPRLIGLVAGVRSRGVSLDTLAADMPNVFAMTSWDFSPTGILAEEKLRVETAATEGTINDFLRIIPGKQHVSIAAIKAGMTQKSYETIIITALSGTNPTLATLGKNLEVALEEYLPIRKHSAPIPAAG